MHTKVLVLDMDVAHVLVAEYGNGSAVDVLGRDLPLDASSRGQVRAARAAMLVALYAQNTMLLPFINYHVDGLIGNNRPAAAAAAAAVAKLSLQLRDELRSAKPQIRLHAKCQDHQRLAVCPGLPAGASEVGIHSPHTTSASAVQRTTHQVRSRSQSEAACNQQVR